MPNHKIFLTGASGFIGSHLAEFFIGQGFQLMGLKRHTSDLWRCEEFADQITWITEETLEENLLTFKPDIIIHLAWSGISASDRENWHLQFSNLQLIIDLTRIGKLISVKKFVAFGSQAEYGNIEGRVDETIHPIPKNAYAVAKLAAQKTVEIFCEQNDIQWYWLRIYSVFGPKEDKKWFVPMIIDHLLNDLPCNLTRCEQQYDYLYVKDLAKMVLTVINSNDNHSGVYNLSSNQSRSLRSLITEINDIIGSKSVLSFGALPYRQNQSMHIEGNSDLYNHVFGAFTGYDMRASLIETIDYYRGEN
ncbi:NAD-dependent epimerase/dehydratase family protein [Dyadobacter arcticus]|uniref:Nucleoside-diphosphate-sugar epimerase n=1 Tax=Dyadobacter arcticus TaxID=1078754 RepID=A0ABX0UEZ1_9BACT|nr:NAD(P)-dependent oxidoreductase [Dyadobacter arcticus]NIJ51574.1 nucleoside-diphosphate-sugar epimerase [Dyadobacter arcticus]